MRSRWLMELGVAAGGAWVLCASLALYAEPPGDAASRPNDGQKVVSGERADGEHRVSVAVARDRATLMHRIYAVTLDVMHRHYFRKNQSTLPARAMEDVFSEMAGQSKVKAHWISVNTKAMSVDHEPETEFEKKAATEIAAGKEMFELVEKGYYRSASAIPLGDGCVGCHTGLFTASLKSPRFAGLVISVPINED